MDNTIPCFINNDGKAVIGCGVGADRRPEYRFDLETRRLVPPTYSSDLRDKSAKNFLDEHVGTPEKLMEFAKQSDL